MIPANPPSRRGPRRGLGRGLDALLASTHAEEAGGEPILVNLDPNVIAPNPEQPRRNFDEPALDALAESIRMHGLLHPIVVERAAAGYQLVAGERRLRAAQRAGVNPIPALVRPASESGRQSLELALTENIHRLDLDPMEQAAAFARLQDAFGLSDTAIARHLGKAPTTVTNTIRLLRLSPAVQRAVSEGRITAGHARALIMLPHPEQEELARQVEATGMTVRAIESLSQARLARTREPETQRRPLPEPAEAGELLPDDEALRRGLEQALGLPVVLRRLRTGGHLILSFSSDDDLDSLYRRLGGPPL